MFYLLFSVFANDLFAGKVKAGYNAIITRWLLADSTFFFLTEENKSLQKGVCSVEVGEDLVLDIFGQRGEWPCLGVELRQWSDGLLQRNVWLLDEQANNFVNKSSSKQPSYVLMFAKLQLKKSCHLLFPRWVNLSSNLLWIFFMIVYLCVNFHIYFNLIGVTHFKPPLKYTSPSWFRVQNLSPNVRGFGRR
jgi:hypothetical protein